MSRYFPARRASSGIGAPVFGAWPSTRALLQVADSLQPPLEAGDMPGHRGRAEFDALDRSVADALLP
jgi:hypothetical protein